MANGFLYGTHSSVKCNVCRIRLIKAVIFDMDGVLLDSEPLWKLAETEVFNSIGVPLTFEMCETTVGMRLKDVVELWHSKYPSSHIKMSFADVEFGIINKLIALIVEKSVLNRGVIKALNFFESKHLPMAVASSSDMKIIDTVLNKFDLRKRFSVIHSAEFEEHGKPHPAIYNTAAGMLGVAPHECLAIEDSLNGLKSAISAGMKTIAVPEARSFMSSDFDIADLKIRSLEEFSEKQFSELNSLK